MIPTLVLGNGVTALGVLRVLGRARIRSYSYSHSTGIEARSRWHRSLPLGSAAASGKPELEILLAACGVGEGVLFPCSDYWLTQVASLREDLSRRYPASVASLSAITTLVDKAKFGSLLGELGVPHPYTQVLKGPWDIDRVSDAVLESAFLKPHDSQQFFARFGVKAFQIHSREEAVSKAGAAFGLGLPVLLQEYVPGPGSQHYFVDGFFDRHGRLRAAFVRRRLRMHPPDFGNSSYMVSVGEEEARQAVNTVEKTLSHIGFRGIFSAEFKLDARDGLFKLLEVNARPWWYVEFAARCGVDVCSLAYRDAVGEDCGEIDSYVEGARLVYPYYDYHACKEAFQARELRASDWARSWLGSQQPLFNWTDPMPALAEFGSTLKSMVRRGGSSGS